MECIKEKLRHWITDSIFKSTGKLPSEKRRKKAARIITKHHPLVLMYHSVISEYNNEDYTVSRSTLEQNIIDLIEDGYSFAFEDEFYSCRPKSVILTFDDGYANNYTEVFPLLKKYHVKASINIITDKVSDLPGKYLSREQILEMRDSGLVQFQSHTCTHRSLNKLTPEEIRFELMESKRKLQELIQDEVSVLVYPREDFTEEIARMASVYYDLCYGWGGEMQVDVRYSLPRIEIVESCCDYAYRVLLEYRTDSYHKMIWPLLRKNPTNTYRRVLF